MAYVYSAVYWGSTHGGPHDYAVHCDYEGSAALHILPIHHDIIQVSSMEDAQRIADLLNSTRAIVVPIR
jgi:hypothetical protein